MNSLRLLRTLACVGLAHAVVVLPAAGQGMADPTRPPAGLLDERAPADTVTASGPVLQTVMISPSSAFAIISGRKVVVGDMVGEARVARISEEAVQLRRGKEVLTLKMYPDILKLPASERMGGKNQTGDNKGK